MNIITSAGFLIPILGISYREISIRSRDRPEYEEINDMMRHPWLPELMGLDGGGRWGYLRALILRSLVLLPSMLWALKLSNWQIDLLPIYSGILLFVIIMLEKIQNGR